MHGTHVMLEKTFQETFATYSDAIFRFCLLKVSAVPLAEDMTQEVFMRYWQLLKAGREMTNTRSLLYTVAHNLAKDWYKKKKTESLDRRMEGGFEPQGGGVSAEEESAYIEALAVIHDMDESDKEVLLLSYVEGLPPADIAAILGETPNVVSVRLNRAMKRLQKKLHV